MTRYPSRKEVNDHQRAELDRLRRETVYAEYEDPKSPAIDYRAVVGERGYTSPSPGPGETNPLLREHAQLLRRACEYPNDGLGKHYKALGVGIEKGNSLLRHLTAAGYVTVCKSKQSGPSGGRRRYLLVLTPNGRHMLEAYDQKNAEA
jgi:hypothetical protein